MIEGCNESHLFYNGQLIKNVSVGSYIKIPCGFDLVIGVIEGEIQQERDHLGANVDDRLLGTIEYDRILEISVFGVLSGGRFDRGLTVLPLMGSPVYVLEPEELKIITNANLATTGSFSVGTLSGHSDITVSVSASKLFASHIGIFGNTGSGKSNTLCKLYTDCFKLIEENKDKDKCYSRFIFIDFNGEYTANEVLTKQNKTVYKLSSSSNKGDRFPVPVDFYHDLSIWAMLSSATEKTQKPFLAKVIRLSESIQSANNPEAYTLSIVKKVLASGAANPTIFVECKNYLVKALSFLVDKDNITRASDDLEETLEHIEIFAQRGKLVLRQGEFYCDASADIDEFFACTLSLLKGFSDLISDNPSFMTFCAYILYVQKCLNGSIARESIAWWLPRYEDQLQISSKLYEVKIYDHAPVVSVVSLIDVNQEQKKTIPLVVAKYSYDRQKKRNALNIESSTHLIIDEAHNILSQSSIRESEGWRDYRLETFEEIIKEGRKFGMYLTLASQRPSDISPTIISQLHNYFIHRLVNDEDLRAISKAVAFIDSANFSMIPVLSQGCCVMSGTATPYPIRIQIPALPKSMRPASGDRDLYEAWTSKDWIF
jgi:hypothetical protein